MKVIKYFLEFIVIITFLIINRILGLKLSQLISSFIFKKIGPLVRSKKISFSNLETAFPNLDNDQKNRIINNVFKLTNVNNQKHCQHTHQHQFIFKYYS